MGTRIEVGVRGLCNVRVVMGAGSRKHYCNFRIVLHVQDFEYTLLSVSNTDLK